MQRRWGAWSRLSKLRQREGQPGLVVETEQNEEAIGEEMAGPLSEVKAKAR